MDIVDLFNRTPFVELLGIEVTEASDGHAEARLGYDESLRSNEHGEVMHGGVTYALADTAGGAAVISLSMDVSPTVDMRMDYLAPATSDLYATADVIRHGSSLSMVQVDVANEDGDPVATAQGTYKTSGQGDETPWLGDG
ncbi:thioesterase [Halobacteriales archaeon QS_4_66_20]|nr:MAG: thioesterase [Halobacteriales archaeon QS_4_66_20]